MPQHSFRFFIGIFLLHLLAAPSCGLADERAERVTDAIERLKLAPQWSHLDAKIVSETFAYQRSGPELNAAVHVFAPDGKPLASALVVIGESESDLANFIYRLEINPEKLRLPLALDVTDTKGVAVFRGVSEASLVFEIALGPSLQLTLSY